jgi:hypothetical protein
VTGSSGEWTLKWIASSQEDEPKFARIEGTSDDENHGTIRNVEFEVGAMKPISR